MHDVLHLYTTLCLSASGELEDKAAAGQLLLGSILSKQLLAVFGFCWVFFPPLKVGNTIPQSPSHFNLNDWVQDNNDDKTNK